MFQTTNLYSIHYLVSAMAWKPIHFGLAGMMLVFGSFNTLSVKWADTMTSESVDGTKRPFNHPFLQATGMFLGEMLCMVAFWVVKFRASRQPTSAYPPLTMENAPKKFNPLVSFRYVKDWETSALNS